MNVQELGQSFELNIGRAPIDVTIDFAFPFLEQPRDVTVRMLSFDVDGQPHACLLIQDVSAQRSIERMKETLSSLLVHDFKNPLAVVLSNLEFARALPHLGSRPDARAHGGDATVDCPPSGGSVFRFEVSTRAPVPSSPERA